MNIEDILKEIIEKLEKYQIDYMITGSFASNLHGTPRATFDADIVVSTDFKKIENFLKEIEKDFYVNLESAKEAFKERKMFNIIHFETGFKIDFIVKKEGKYYENEFNRRKIFKLKDKPCFFASSEDTILAKLIWAKKSESEKQFNDALGIIKIQKENLNYDYLKKWAHEIGVYDLLQEILKEAEKEE